MKVYINGKLFDKEEAKISVFDHGLLYGDGVFEGIRSYGGTVFRLKEHLDRLYDSAKAILLEIPISKEEMAKAVKETLDANGIKDGYIRLIVTRGVGTLGLDPNRCSEPQIHNYHRYDCPLSQRVLRGRAGNRHRQRHSKPSGRVEPEN